MLHYVYTRPLTIIVLLMLLSAVGYGLLCAMCGGRGIIVLCAVVGAVAVAVVVLATLSGREAGEYAVVLRPFASLMLARRFPELYREMLMNIFLFFPLGLALANSLPDGWSVGRRMLLAALAGCIVSMAVEYAQYRLHIGVAETDDVICNTLGALAGSMSLFARRAAEKRKDRS